MGGVSTDPAEVQRRVDELAALREQLRESEQALARLPALERDAAIAADDRKELDSMRTRLDIVQAELARAKADLEGAEQELLAMQRKLSWRITRPLRALRRAL